jgi:hypothetical protein
MSVFIGTVSVALGDAILMTLFSNLSLSGTAGWQQFLRPGGAALYCFCCAVLRISGSWQNVRLSQTNFSGSFGKMQTLALGAGANLLNCAPRESRAEKGESKSCIKIAFP